VVRKVFRKTSCSYDALPESDRSPPLPFLPSWKIQVWFMSATLAMSGGRRSRRCRWYRIPASVEALRRLKPAAHS